MARTDAVYSMDGEPQTGAYDALVTQDLQRRLEQWGAAGFAVQTAGVDKAEAAALMGRFIGEAATRALAAADDPLALANRFLDALTFEKDGAPAGVPLAAGPKKEHAAARLLSIVRDQPGAGHPEAPSTPLSQAALLTNSKSDPNLAHELAKELDTADSVDLLCAFVKWSGLRILAEQLAVLRDRRIPVRVITTTYMGATERGALDRLVRDFGAEVRISYEQRTTRLHAKAWLLRRRSGFDTAYVGSSNLSRAALLDGLEWNVRLSAVATPRLIDKFEGTFDSYWQRSDFEPYDPDRDAERVDRALEQAGAGTRGTPLYEIPVLAPHPYPHQREILEDLDVQREVHGRHRNLVVAATGTGKTVVAAFDYRNLQERLGRQPNLLFLAHREEILVQSRRTYQQVLPDRQFGELHVGQHRAGQWRHVFASVQSLGADRLARLPADHFDVIVMDEFHHADAPSYRRILDHFAPRELLGLTATPERADGVRVQDEFFAGHIASEIRLWDALDADLLSPFHYFGITDDVDLTTVAWSGGGYRTEGLEQVFTGDTARARLVVNALREKVGDVGAVRGLGFCVSVKHAEYMADFFEKQAGIPALAVSGHTEPAARRRALEQLARGAVKFLFAVDLFNEGLDIPDINTLLLLRPTESATVFIQQLGRGLRRTEDKAVLTVLDFVGQHRREYRLEDRFRALTGQVGLRLEQQVADGFPLLPSGCQIVLDRVAKDRVIASIQQHIGADVRTLAREAESLLERNLARFLEAYGRVPADIYRPDRSWTTILRRSGLLPAAGSRLETELVKRMRTLIHVDDAERAEAYRALVRNDGPAYAELDARGQAFARMLYFSLWRDTGHHSSYDEGFTRLRQERAICDEIEQVVQYGIHRPRFVAKYFEDTLPGVPLAVNASYTQEEVLAALGWATINGQVPANFREGVVWVPDMQCDALFVTLHKSEEEFSPQTMYRDYALSPRRFHWESQNRIGPRTQTGMRYQQHKQRGSKVLLFTRERTQSTRAAVDPFVCHGLVEYESHSGERPMAVTWRLREEMPTELYLRAAIAV